MARGDSGRIVVEVEPDLKDRLYVELAKQRLTLKAWFVAAVDEFLQTSSQPSLFAAERPPSPYIAPANPPADIEKP